MPHLTPDATPNDVITAVNELIDAVTAWNEHYIEVGANHMLARASDTVVPSPPTPELPPEE